MTIHDLQILDSKKEWVEVQGGEKEMSKTNENKRSKVRYEFNIVKERNSRLMDS